MAAIIVAGMPCASGTENCYSQGKKQSYGHVGFNIFEIDDL